MLVIDRFEGDIAIIEDGESIINIPKNQLPFNAKDGDILILSDGKYLIDEVATDNRKKELENRFSKLFK